MAYYGTTVALTGLVSNYIGEDPLGRTVKTLLSENVLTEVLFRLTDAPTGGNLVVELNDQQDGNGTAVQVTIAAGETYAISSGLTASMGALYQIVKSEGGSQTAMNLTGEYTLQSVVGVEDFFTTLDRVKDAGEIAGVDATRDSVINRIIAGVTREMQDWMGRDIVQGTATAEKIDGWYDEEIRTRHFPINSITSLTESDAALVEDTDFEATADDLAQGRIIRLSGGKPTNWATGRRTVSVTYDHGYITVPESLAQAATTMTLVRYLETPEGKGWLGLSSKGVQPNSATTYDKEIWEREVIPAMRPFRRLAS